MAVYREHRTIDRPPAAVASAVFGDADARHRVGRVAGLYRVETVLDTDDGLLRTRVDAPGLAALTAVAVGVAALGVASPTLRLAGGWLCALAVLAPLGHLLPQDARPAVGRVTTRRVSPVTAPAFAAALGSLWLTLAPELGDIATVFCAALLVVGAACYAVGAGWGTATVSTLWLPAAGLLPLVSTLAAFAVVLALDGARGVVAVRAGVAVAGIAVVVVTAYSYLVGRSMQAVRFEPLAPGGRRLLLAGYLVVLALFVGILGEFVRRVATQHGAAVAVVLAAPLSIPVGGWLLHGTRTVVARAAAVRRADRRTVDDVTLYVLPTDAVVATAVSVPNGILISQAVLETLSSEEVAAVVAHERHHLTARSRVRRGVVSLAAVVVGRNPIAAFNDAAAAERSADRAAAARVGSASLIRALRRLERLEADARPAPSVRSAPQALLFGSVAETAVYPSVDDRVAALTRAG